MIEAVLDYLGPKVRYSDDLGSILPNAAGYIGNVLIILVFTIVIIGLVVGLSFVPGLGNIIAIVIGIIGVVILIGLTPYIIISVYNFFLVIVGILSYLMKNIGFNVKNVNLIEDSLNVSFWFRNKIN